MAAQRIVCPRCHPFDEGTMEFELFANQTYDLVCDCAEKNIAPGLPIIFDRLKDEFGENSSVKLVFQEVLFRRIELESVTLSDPDRGEVAVGTRGNQ